MVSGPTSVEEDRAPRAAAQARWPARVRATLGSDPAAIARVAAAVVGRPGARLLTWDVAPLGPGSDNPTSGGLYRVSGEVDSGGPVPWAAVLKVVRSPVEIGDRMADPANGNYWRREVDVLASGLLDRLPPGLAAPRHYGWTEFDDDAAWLWNEDLGALGAASWSADRVRCAARHLATFHAAYLTGTLLPDHPWLNNDYLRGFLAYARPPIARILDLTREGHPEYRDLHPEHAQPAIAPLIALLRRPEPLLAALDATPRTLCHHDTHLDNLLLRPGPAGGEELVAIDWQLVGRGPVGADLGQLLTQAPPDVRPTDRAAFEASVVDAYVDTLADAGAQVPDDVTRAAYAAHAALRETCWEFFLLALDLLRLRRGLLTAGAGRVGAGRAGAGLVGAARDRVGQFVAEVAAGHLPALAADATARSGEMR